MPRPPRIDFPGAWHHVFDRGRARQAIFFDDDDRFIFFDCIAQAVKQYCIEVHAYSLMPNHWHLLVRSVQGHLSRAIRHLKSLYTQQLNVRHGLDGSLFKGRFKSELVQNEAYLVYLLAYIHRNPLKANLITRLDAAGGWTSHRQYMNLERPYPWLSRAFFLEQLGDAQQLDSLILNLHRGVIFWPPGLDDDTGHINWKKADLTASINDLSRAVERGRTIESVLEELSEITTVTIGELRRDQRGPTGNMAKRFAVWALRERTTLSYSQIGKQLKMTESAVAKTLGTRRQPSELIDRWSAQWLTRHQEKFAVVL